MARVIKAPTVGVQGEELHPAFGLIGASRISVSSPGSSLFDSDIRHNHTVIVRIKRAVRYRDLNRDWLGGREELIEVEMSEAQWASFVSSMNTGDGVPCTIRNTGKGGDTPGIKYAPRMAESLREVDEAAAKTFGEIEAALHDYEEHKTAGNFRTLRATVLNAEANINFTAQSMAAHAESVVQRARADIEAYVVAKAKQLGLEPGAVASPFEIEAR